MKHFHHREAWTSVLGYEGLYEVSDLGRIRRVKSGRYLRFFKGRCGRPRVDLSKHCKREKFYVYDVVLTAFVGPRPEGCFALHWNDDSWDNRLSNLRWGTRKMNAEDGKRNKAPGLTLQDIAKPDRSYRYHVDDLCHAYWLFFKEYVFGNIVTRYMDVSSSTGVDTSTIEHVVNKTSTIIIEESDVERWLQSRHASMSVPGNVPF